MHDGGNQGFSNGNQLLIFGFRFFFYRSWRLFPRLSRPVMSFPVREVIIRIEGVERKWGILKQQLFQGQETVLALEVSCAFNFALLFPPLFFPFSAGWVGLFIFVPVVFVLLFCFCFNSCLVLVSVGKPFPLFFFCSLFFYSWM